MLNITADKLLYYPGRIAGDFRPITADVFLTNFCNNRCSWCTYNRWDRDPSSVGMSAEEFKRYADKLISIGVQGIILTGGGEPTINRDFDEIVHYLESNGIHYGINTNFNRLRLFSPDYLKVSLDGFDEDSYERVRGVRAYGKTVENIQEFLRWKKENGKATSVGIQMVVTDPDDIVRFYMANAFLAVDYIVYRPVESTLGSYYSGRNMESVGRIVELVNKLSEDDSRVILNYKWSHLRTRFKKCSAHWAQIALDEKGNVMYCCHKPYEVIGHILDDDILEKIRAANTDMSMCDVPCRMTAPNGVFEEAAAQTVNKQFI